MPEIDLAVREVPEVAHVYGQGYRITHDVENGVFVLRARASSGEQASILAAKFRPADARLYIRSAGTLDHHQQKGLGTALIVAAVITAGCKKVTSSEPNWMGKKLLAKAKPVITRLGVEFINPRPLPLSTEVVYFSDEDE